MPLSAIEEEIIGSLRRIAQAFQQQSSTLAQGHGLTGPQLAILQHVAQHESVTVSSLAKAAYLGAPTVSGILHRLEKQGFIVRSRSEVDRRQVNARVTESGRLLLSSKPSLLKDVFRERLARLEDWEQQMILTSLRRIVGMMESPPLPPAGSDSPADPTAGPKKSPNSSP